MPRVYVFRSLVIMAVLVAADLADGESVFTEGALVLSLVVADCYLTGCLLGWVLARMARSAPVIDRVMMSWVVPLVGTFELVRKSKGRMDEAAAEEHERRRQRLTPD